MRVRRTSTRGYCPPGTFRPFGERIVGSAMVTAMPCPGAGTILLPIAVKPSVEPSKVQSLTVLSGLPLSSKPPVAGFQCTGPARSTIGPTGAAGAWALPTGRPQEARIAAAATRASEGTIQVRRFTGAVSMGDGRRAADSTGGLAWPRSPATPPCGNPGCNAR